MKKTSEMLAKSAIKGLSDVAPLIVLGITLLSFALLGVIEYNYYAEYILKGNLTNWGLVMFVAGGVAAFVQLLRSGLVLMSIRDFSADRDGRGFFGLLFSLAATIYCTFEISHLAEAWSAGNPTLSGWIGTVLYFVNWAGFALEVRIALSVSADDPAEIVSPGQKSGDIEELLTPDEYASYKAYKEQPVPSKNGQHVMQNEEERPRIIGFKRSSPSDIATDNPIIATENIEAVIDLIQDKYRRAFLKHKLSILKAHQNNLRIGNGRPETVKKHIQTILSEIEQELTMLKEEALQQEA
jgi:hypothetical protein